MGDKLLLILAWNCSEIMLLLFIISHMKLQNCKANVWCEIYQYNKQVKKPIHDCKWNLSSMIFNDSIVNTREIRK